MAKDQKLQIPSAPSSSSFTLQHKLQSIIQNQNRNQQQHNWDYAILWNLTTTEHSEHLLSWGDAYFEPHHRLQPSTARELPAGDGDILSKSVSSGEVVWLNDHRQREESERAKQALGYGIQTLVCIPTPNGVIEFGSPDVITQDCNFVEKVNAEFGFSINSTDIKHVKVESQEELNHRYCSLRSVVPNVSRMGKASLLSGAVSYINELQMKIEELESQVPRDPSENSEELEVSSRDEAKLIEVEVKIIGEEAVIRVESKNVSYAVARLMDGLRDLGLKVHNASMNKLNYLTVQIVVVGVPTGLGSTHESIKEALLTILQTP